ncbi:hypothetical protein SAMN04487995_5202 [Dyadobacter koreensis]|uniref:Uncharacterized protein n=1 Tax=Dyadobacter koreensis TaxID=408657 RepID=A0A1H6ZQM6_9BACT|nr:hypothetical protein SAMN04487995_5202 [Dyadobacter koreensis]
MNLACSKKMYNTYFSKYISTRIYFSRISCDFNLFKYKFFETEPEGKKINYEIGCRQSAAGQKVALSLFEGRKLIADSPMIFN